MRQLAFPKYIQSQTHSAPLVFLFLLKGMKASLAPSLHLASWVFLFRLNGLLALPAPTLHSASLVFLFLLNALTVSRASALLPNCGPEEHF